MLYGEWMKSQKEKERKRELRKNKYKVYATSCCGLKRKHS